MFIAGQVVGHFFSFVILYFVILPQSDSFIRRALFRINCFNHSSWRTTSGLKYRNCDLVFEFCVSESKDGMSCYPDQRSFTFTYRVLLGSCSSEVENNFPDVAFAVNMNDSMRYLKIRIKNVTKSGIIKRRSLIDKIVFNVTNFKNFPGSPFDSQMIANAILLDPVSYHNKGPPAPILKLEAALKCPIYRSGIGCRELCSATPTTMCLPNGTSVCMGNCSTLSSSTEEPLKVSITSGTSPLESDMSGFYMTLIVAICGVVIVVVLVVALVYLITTRRRRKFKLYPSAAPPSGIARRAVLMSGLQEIDNDYYQAMCHGDNAGPSSPYDVDPTLCESVYEDVGPVYSCSSGEYEYCNNDLYKECQNLPETRYVRR